MTLASRLLSYLCDDMLQVDDEWSVRTEDSCTWWPHDLAQRIATRPITDQGGSEGLLLTVETDLLTGVTLDAPDAGQRLNTLAATNALSTVALGDDEVLVLHFSVRVFDDTFGWTSEWAARLSACQAADALDLADRARHIFPNTQRASSDHPSSGRRDDIDGIVGVREATIARSREIGEALDATDLADGLTAIGTRPAEVTAPIGTHTTQTWELPPSDTGRWDDHGELLTVALLTVDDTYGPAVIVMT